MHLPVSSLFILHKLTPGVNIEAPPRNCPSGSFSPIQPPPGIVHGIRFRLFWNRSRTKRRPSLQVEPSVPEQEGDRTRLFEGSDN